jgi:peptidoglycan/xylan/chitin deacetylase (PgdA/CDA1 family)
MPLKTAARIALQHMGGLALFRYANRRKSAVLAFHSFSETTQPNVAAICEYLTRHFELLPLSAIVESVRNRTELPDNALAVTIDDGYKNYLEYGHPIFKRHKILTTLFAVSEFAAGRLWLWPDQLEFALEHTARASASVDLGNNGVTEFALSSPQDKAAAAAHLTEMLKAVPNRQRIDFMAKVGRLCDVEIPKVPPAHRAGMTWEELRAIAADGVEIGCHTATHPILTRLESAAELQAEIRGAKETMEENLGFSIRHFCYPNGKAADFDDTVVASVRAAAFDSAVTCLWGLNSATAEPSDKPWRIQRLPFDSGLEYSYAIELLAGLHL